MKKFMNIFLLGASMALLLGGCADVKTETPNGDETTNY